MILKTKKGTQTSVKYSVLIFMDDPKDHKKGSEY